MDLSIRGAIARIQVMRDGGLVSRGTGFLVTQDLVLTALHVVADRREQPPRALGDTIHLDFPGHTTRAAILEERWDAHADWVLLKCSEPPRSSPLPLLSEFRSTESPWESYGYPDSKPDGMAVAGEVRNADGSVQGTRALQLFSSEAAAGNGMPVSGLSGAPILVDGAVVGLLRWATLDEKLSVGGTLFACPMSMILDRSIEILPVGRRAEAAARPGFAPVPPAAPAAGFRELTHHVLLAYSELDRELMEGCSRQLSQRGYKVRGFPKALFAESGQDFLELEHGLRQCHAAMLLLSEASLNQLRDRSARTARVLAVLRARTGCVTPVWHGPGRPEVPAEWGLGEVITVSPEEMKAWPTEPVVRVEEELRRCIPHPDALTVGLPFVVVAMKKGEAEELESQPELLQRRFGSDMYDHFVSLKNALIEGEGPSFSQRYGFSREEWKPFSNSERTVWEVIEDIVTELNRGPHHTLRKRSIKIQCYPFEETRAGSDLDKVYMELAEMGCIVLADELSMFHWGLREAFFGSPFYNSLQSSLVTLSPVNPCSLASDRILESELRQKLSNAFRRFSGYDPQCELGIGDERRLRRWLHSSLPQAVHNLWNPPPNRPALADLKRELLE
jgi:hypothetical protein